jgi:archaemetzincin
MYENYPFLKEITLNKNFNLPRECWITPRRQYNAECLLDYVENQISDGFVFLIISEDIYIRDLNYVFGIGVPKIGSVISTSRLENNIENLNKIILHEVGHVFGLTHCHSPCSMTPSNNINDVHQIQVSYCVNCKLKLNERAR